MTQFALWWRSLWQIVLLERLVSKDIHSSHYLLGCQTGPAVTYVNVDTAVGGCSLAQVKDFIKYAMIYSVWSTSLPCSGNGRPKQGHLPYHDHWASQWWMSGFCRKGILHNRQWRNNYGMQIKAYLCTRSSNKPGR